MAAEVAQFLWETFVASLKEMKPKFPRSLYDEVREIQDKISQSTLCLSSATEPKLLQYLYDLNDALADSRIFVERKNQELPQNSSLLNRFHRTYFARKMKARLAALEKEWLQTSQNSSSTDMFSNFPTARHTSFEPNASQVLDFGEKQEEIESLLADEGYKAIGVYGKSGSGKTALIRKVLNSPGVSRRFSPIIWVCLSDMHSEDDEENIESEIVKYILHELGCDVAKWTITNPRKEVLLENLRSLLMCKRYLIVFDDVWERNGFYSGLGDAASGGDTIGGNRLSDALPRDSGGKIIVTNRLKEVAKQMVGVKNLIHMVPVNRGLKPSSGFVQSNASQVVGFDEEEKKIEALLSEEGYRAIGVFGMGGSGKTTLIKKVLSSPSVYNSFSLITWVCLSDINFKDDEDIEVDIVKHILCDLGRDVDRWITLDHDKAELFGILKDTLKSKKYLIVFDDVWEKRDFYANLGDTLPASEGDAVGKRLSDAFPKDGDGKIIVTSRLREVAESMVGEKNLIQMKPLNKESCRLILESGTGFLQYATEIESMLKDGEFVAIGVYGPSNSANTALIDRVLSSGSFVGQFETILWVWESHITPKEKESIRSNNPKRMSKELGCEVVELTSPSDNELMENVNRSLAKKYVIVLADLGNRKDGDGSNLELDYRKRWNWLLNELRRNGHGTVIVTSGIKEVAQEIVGEDNLIHVRLPELGTNNETSEVKIHHQYVIEEMVEQCHGLPLAAKTMAKIIREKVSVSPSQPLTLAEKEATADQTTARSKSDDEGPKVAKAPRDLSELLENEILVDPAMRVLQVSYDNLDRLQLKLCLLFLSVFPENEVIKKRPLIYWWIGEGLIKNEEDGEKIFEELLKLDLIKPPHGNGDCPVVNKCQVHPWIRCMLISLARSARLFDFDSTGIPPPDSTDPRRACLVLDARNSWLQNTTNSSNLRTIFNVNDSYLDIHSDWIAGLKKLVVLQLGRWQDSATHHIEVQSEAFLKVLRTHDHLKYVSFR